MSKIRVIFYKSKWGDKKWIDNLISLWTRSKYSHVEIWTPDKCGHFCGIGNWGVPSGKTGDKFGTCWTSTMRGEDNGTVRRDASGVLDHPWRWDYMEIELEPSMIFPDHYDSMMMYMEPEIDCNKGYAKKDILKFIIPHVYKWFNLTDKSRNICSEFVANALLAAGVFDKGGVVSPKAVHKKLTKLGYKTKELK